MYRLKLEKFGGEEMSRIILVTSHSSCGIVHAAAGERGCFSCSEPVTSARVIGTVSTEEKGKTGRQAGTTDIILYMQQDSDVETKRLTNGHGADLTIDGVGKAGFTGNLDAAVLREIS
jgi:NADPH2:quinone reductase